MDYGDKKYQGVYQFNPLRKQEVCQQVSKVLHPSFANNYSAVIFKNFFHKNIIDWVNFHKHTIDGVLLLGWAVHLLRCPFVCLCPTLLMYLLR